MGTRDIQIDFEFEDPYGFDIGEPERYLLCHVGTVRAWSAGEIEEADGRLLPAPIGSVTAWVIDPFSVAEAGASVSYMMDAQSSDLSRFTVLLDDDEVRDDLAELGSAIVLIDRVQLERQWRGRGIGREVVARTALSLSRGIGIVAIEAAPIADADESRLAGTAWDDAAERIARNWERVGFNRVDDTRILAMDLAQHSSAEALRACF